MILNIAHRGASAAFPENTLLAFKQALKLSANGIECDVHLCKSGEPVVIHDTTLERTTNGKGRVAAHTLAQLKKLDAGKGETIPTLKETIETINGRAVLFIEIKDKACAAPVARIVAHYAKQFGYEKLPVISFSVPTLLAVQKENPHILLGATPPQDRITAAFAKRAHDAGFYSVNPCIDRLTGSFVQHAHKLDLKVFCWTANTLAKIAKAKKLGVDGIISDYPDRV